MKKQNKTFKIILTLCCFLAFSISALASNPQAPPLTGIGVVVKKNPGGGASKATTGKDGSFSLELVKGSYLVSLNKDQLLKAGQELATSLNPKSKYLFNGDGTQLVITDNENIIMSQLEGDAGSDLLLITALKPTTLSGSLLWDNSVINQPQVKSSYVGHVTLLRKNGSSQNMQIFCPTGTIGLDGKCVPIKEFENTTQGKTADYAGHITLLRKNGSAMKVTTTNCPDGFELKDGTCVPIKVKVEANVVNKTKANTKDNFTKADCPDGFELKDGTCVPIKVKVEANVVNKTKANTKDNFTKADCPDGYVLKDGICVKELPSTTNQPQAMTEGSPLKGHIVTGGKGNTVAKIGHVTLLKKNAAMIYIGGGISNPTATTKEAGIVNGIDINVSVYKPIWAWEQSGISLGINAGGGYTMGNSDYALDSRYTVYQLQGQSAPPTVSAKGNGSPKAQGFKFEAGPQMRIPLGDRFSLSPIFNVGYMSMEQKEFTVTETVQENTVDYPYVLLSQKATKTSGLGIIPKVRLAYNITPTIGIWVEGSYTMGSTISTESTRFVLDPTIPSTNYNLGHFQEGQYVTSKADAKYTAIGISGGIVISLGTRNSSFIKWSNEGSSTPPVGTLNPGGTTTPPVAAPTTHAKVVTTSDIQEEWKSLVPVGTQWLISGGSACQLEPSCGAGGIYCRANSPSFSEAKYPLNEDQIMTASAIKLVGTNNIVIYNLGLKNNLTAATMQKFISKKVDVQPTVLPLSLMAPLFKSIDLPEPKQPITFGKENITYEVMNTTNEGKDVQVIQINEKTKINIDGKEYNVTVITTSGKGSGSPKNQGF